MCDRKLVFVEIAGLWILPILIWLPATCLEEGVTFATGGGLEDGRACYAFQNDKMVYLTTLQVPMLVVTEILVLVIVILSCMVVLWVFKQEVDETREKQKSNDLFLFRYNIITEHKKRSLNMSMGIISFAFVVLRLPWLIFATSHCQEVQPHDIGYRTSSIFYIMKYNVMVILFGLSNKNFRRAYLDVIKLCFPCCLKNKTPDDN